MSKKNFVNFLFVVFIAGIMNSTLAQNQSKTGGKMNPAMPGPMHEHLKKLTGTWEQTIKITPMPGAKPLEAKVVTDAKMIYDGRFLQMTGDVEFMGQKGEGLTIIGHDNHSNKYTFYNIASASTDATFAKGTYDEEQKQFTFHGENQDPMTGKQRSFKIIITLVNENMFRQENYFKYPDQDEFKAVEVISKQK